jgi:hypothetical protein
VVVVVFLPLVVVLVVVVLLIVVLVLVLALLVLVLLFAPVVPLDAVTGGSFSFFQWHYSLGILLPRLIFLFTGKL